MNSKLMIILAIDAVATIGVLGAVFAWWKCDTCPSPDKSTIIQSGNIHSSVPSSDFCLQFADAFRAKDMARLKCFYCWDRVDSWTAQLVEESIADDLKNTLVDVAVLPIDSNNSLEYVR